MEHSVNDVWIFFGWSHAVADDRCRAMDDLGYDSIDADTIALAETIGRKYHIHHWQRGWIDEDVVGGIVHVGGQD